MNHAKHPEKSLLRSLAILLIILIWAHQHALAGDSSEASGNDSDALPPAPYLGLVAPLNAAEVFAPGIVSTTSTEIMYAALNKGHRLIFERTPADFKKGDTAFIYLMDLLDGKWSGPKASPFPITEWYKNFNDIEPGGEMVIAKARPQLTPEDPFLLDLWSVQRDKNSWTEPKILTINSDKFDTWPSVSTDGTLYFFSGREGGAGGYDIYRSKKADGVYAGVENLGPVINTAADELDPLIAPDESYLVFCSKARGGFGGQDLFVSFALAGDAWSIPKNMGETVNTSGEDMRPVLSADGKYLFFTSNVSGVLNVHWVDTSFIKQLRP